MPIIAFIQPICNNNKYEILAIMKCVALKIKKKILMDLQILKIIKNNTLKLKSLIDFNARPKSFIRLYLRP
jgi:hypothetical protein